MLYFNWESFPNVRKGLFIFGKLSGIKYILHKKISVTEKSIRIDQVFIESFKIAQHFKSIKEV